MFNWLRIARRTSRAQLFIPALVAASFLGSALLAGCDQKPVLSFQNLDITGNRQFADHFDLPDTNGQMRTLADYRGKIVALVFGYTHFARPRLLNCPGPCSNSGRKTHNS